MEGSRKLKIGFSIGLVFILVTVGIVFSIINNNNAKQEENDVVTGQTDLSKVPYITSLPPAIGYVGLQYTYDIKYSDSDSKIEDIVVTSESIPQWMDIEGLRIYGIPPVGSNGQYKFNVRISDGVNSTVQENYILIQNNEED